MLDSSIQVIVFTSHVNMCFVNSVIIQFIHDADSANANVSAILNSMNLKDDKLSKRDVVM
jgi:hypothetical protein